MPPRLFSSFHARLSEEPKTPSLFVVHLHASGELRMLHAFSNNNKALQ